MITSISAHGPHVYISIIFVRRQTPYYDLLQWKKHQDQTSYHPTRRVNIKYLSSTISILYNKFSLFSVRPAPRVGIDYVPHFNFPYLKNADYQAIIDALRSYSALSGAMSLCPLYRRFETWRFAEIVVVTSNLSLDGYISYAMLCNIENRVDQISVMSCASSRSQCLPSGMKPYTLECYFEAITEKSLPEHSLRLDFRDRVGAHLKH